MSDVNAISARAFVNAIELPDEKSGPDVFRSIRELGSTAGIDFDTYKNQATVVGCEVVSFVTGVAAERRQDITNAALLAQLAATRRVPDRRDIFAWYDAYFEVLARIGWVIQDTGFNSCEEETDGLEAHEAILEVAAAAFGPASTALAVITATVEAMKSMDADDPWITLFDQESRSAETARFQVALAERSPDGEFAVSTLAFGVKAEASITQILFFKIRKSHMSFKNCTGKATINEDVLGSVRETIRTRLAERVNDYVQSIDL